MNNSVKTLKSKLFNGICVLFIFAFFALFNGFNAAKVDAAIIDDGFSETIVGGGGGGTGSTAIETLYVSSSGYSTLQAAINAASATTTTIIQLQKSVTECVTVPYNSRTYVLELNTYHVSCSGNYAITNNGKLTIQGTGKIYSTNSGTIFNTHTLKIMDGPEIYMSERGDADYYVITTNSSLEINSSSSTVQTKIHTDVRAKAIIGHEGGSVKLYNKALVLLDADVAYGIVSHSNGNVYIGSGAVIDDTNTLGLSNIGFEEDVCPTVDIHGTLTTVGMAIRIEGDCETRNGVINIHPGAVLSAAKSVIWDGVTDAAVTFNISGGTITTSSSSYYPLELSSANHQINITGPAMIKSTASTSIFSIYTDSSISITGDATLTGGVNVDGNASFNMSAGTITRGAGAVTMDGTGDFTISGGTITCTSDVNVCLELDNTGSVTISGGTINGGPYVVVSSSSSSFLMSGGKITGGANREAIFINTLASGTFTMTGGTITGANIGINLGTNDLTSAKISGGTINAISTALKLSSSSSNCNVEITGGTFTSSSDNTIVFYGKSTTSLTIKGSAVVESTVGYSVYSYNSSSTLNVGSSSEKLSDNSPLIRSKSSKAAIYCSGTWNYYNGSLWSKSSTVYNKVYTGSRTGNITTGTVSYGGATYYKVSYGNVALDFNGNIAYYPSITEAIESAMGTSDMLRDTITMLSSFGECVTIPSGKFITLELNTFTLTTCAAATSTIINNGNLYINLSSTSGNIYGLGSTSVNIVHNTGVLKINKAVIVSSSSNTNTKKGIQNEGSNANLYLEDVEIKSSTGVYNNGGTVEAINSVINTSSTSITNTGGGTFRFAGGSIQSAGTAIANTNGIFNLEGASVKSTSTSNTVNAVYVTTGTFNIHSVSSIEKNSPVSTSTTEYYGAVVGLRSVNAVLSIGKNGDYINNMECDAIIKNTGTGHAVKGVSGSTINFNSGCLYAGSSNASAIGGSSTVVSDQLAHETFVDGSTFKRTTVAVAEINGTYFGLLDDAINNSGSTSNLIHNTSENIALPSGVTHTINLNGKEWKHYEGYVINNAGTLTITGTGKIYSEWYGTIYNTGSLTIKDGPEVYIFKGPSTTYNVITNSGSLTINSSTSTVQTKIYSSVQAQSIIYQDSTSGKYLNLYKNALVTDNGSEVLKVIMTKGTTIYVRAGASVTATYNSSSSYAIHTSGSSRSTSVYIYGSVSSTYGYAIYHTSTYSTATQIKCDSGSTVSSKYSALYAVSDAKGQFIVSGGTVSTTISSGYPIYVLGANVAVTVSGGTVSAYATTAKAIHSYSNLTIRGSSTTINGYVGVYSTAKFTMEGGTINTTSSSYGIYATNTTASTISGGTITTTGNYGIQLNANANYTITGGSITGKIGIYSSSSYSPTVTITGNAKIESTNTYAISLLGSSTILVIGSVDEAVSENSPLIRSNSSSSAINCSGTWNYYNGSLWSKGSTVYNKAPAASRDGLTYNTSTATYNDSTYYKVLYSTLTLTVGSTTTSHSSIMDAINTIPSSGSGTIELLADMKECITIPEGKNVTLNFNGHSLSYCGVSSSPVITNSGTLYINSDGTTGTIYGYNSTTYKIIENNRILNISNLDIQGFITSPIYAGYGIYQNSGSLTISNSSITSYNGIYKVDGSAVINYVNISSYYFAIFNDGSGSTIISGSSSSPNTITTMGLMDTSATIRINGGSLTVLDYVTISGSVSSSTLEGYGATISLGANGVLNLGNPTSYVSNASCDLLVKNDGTGYAVNGSSGSVINFYTGCLYGASTKSSAIGETATLKVTPSKIDFLATLSSNIYMKTVVAVASVGETNYASLSELVLNVTSTKNITLLTNIRECISVTGTAAVTINLNGKTLSCYGGYVISNTADLTITGSGYVFSQNHAAIKNDNVLTIKDGPKVYVSGTVTGQYVIENNMFLFVNTSSSTVETKIYTATSMSGIISHTAGVVYLNNAALITDNGNNVTYIIRAYSDVYVYAGATVNATYNSSSSRLIYATYDTSLTNLIYGANLHIYGTLSSTYGYGIYYNNPYSTSTAINVYTGASITAKYHAIYANSSATVNGTSTTVKGKITISGGTIKTTYSSDSTYRPISVAGTSVSINITGAATIEAYNKGYRAIYSYSNVNITGNVTIKGYVSIYSTATFSMSNGKIDSTATYGLYSSGGNITISGGSIITTGSYGIQLVKTLNLSITGGTIKGGTNAIYSSSSYNPNVTITGNTTIESTSGNAIKLDGTTATLTLGSESEAISENSPLVRSINSYPTISVVGNWNFYNGSVWAYGGSPGKLPTSTRTGGNVQTTSITYDSKSYNVLLYATVQMGTTYFSSIQSAINSITGVAGTIELLGNTTECVTIPRGLTITLNFNGYSLTTCATTMTGDPVITNNGTLNINSDGTSGSIYGMQGTTYKLIKNSASASIMTINNLTINSYITSPISYGYGIYNESAYPLNLNNCNISANYAIYNTNADATITLNNCTIDTNYGVINQGGTINLVDTDVSAIGYAIYNTNNGIVNISGTKADDKSTILINASSIATIESFDTSVVNISGYVEIISPITITSVIGKASTIALFGTSVLNLGVVDNYIDNVSCKLMIKNTNTGYAVNGDSGTTVNFYSGCLLAGPSTGSAIGSNVTVNVSPAKVDETVTIDSVSYIKTTVATVSKDSVYYSSISQAVAPASNSLTLENNVEECLVVSVGATTINLNGKNLYCNGNYVINITYSPVSVTIQGSGHVFTDNYTAISNSGRLTIKDGVQVYKNSGSYDYNVIDNLGTLAINTSSSTVETKVYTNVSAKYIISNGSAGSVHLYDSALITDNGKQVEAIIRNGCTVNVYADATVSGTYGSSYKAIHNYGSSLVNVNIYGKVNYTSSGYGIYHENTNSSSNITVYQGAFITTQYTSIYTSSTSAGTIELKGGTISNNYISEPVNNLSTSMPLNITGPVVISSSAGGFYGIASYSEINISNGTVYGKVAAYSSFSMSNGVINTMGTGSSALYLHNSLSATITGGTIKGTEYAISSSSSYSPSVTITGNTKIESTSSNAIKLEGTSSTLTLGSQSEFINENTPLVRTINSYPAVHIKGTWNFYNGSIWAYGPNTYGGGGTLSSTRSDGLMRTSTITYNNILYSVTLYATVQMGLSYFGSVQSAIDSIAENGTGTIEMLANLNECINVPVGKTVNLNFNDYYLKACDSFDYDVPVIKNSGTLNINSNDSSGSVYGIDEAHLNAIIDNSGSLVINKLAIATSADIYYASGMGVGISNSASATVTLNESTIDAYRAIENYSGARITINNSSIYSSEGIDNSRGIVDFNDSLLSVDGFGIFNNGGTVNISGSSLSSKSVFTNATISSFGSGIVNISGYVDISSNDNDEEIIYLDDTSVLNLGTAGDYIDNKNCSISIMNRSSSGYAINGTVNATINFHSGCLYSSSTNSSSIGGDVTINVSPAKVDSLYTPTPGTTYMRTVVAVAYEESVDGEGYLASVVDAAYVNTTITLYKNVKECLTLSLGTKTINLNGNNIYCDGNYAINVQNSTTVTIQGSGEIFTDNYATITNSGDLTIKDGVQVYYNSGPSYYVVLVNNGKLSISSEDSTLETKIYTNAPLTYVISESGSSTGLYIYKNALITDNSNNTMDVIANYSNLYMYEGSSIVATNVGIMVNSTSKIIDLNISGTITSANGAAIDYYNTYSNSNGQISTITIGKGANISTSNSSYTIYSQASSKVNLVIRGGTISNANTDTSSSAIKVEGTSLAELNINGLYPATISSVGAYAISVANMDINITSASTITGGVRFDAGSLTMNNKDASITSSSGSSDYAVYKGDGAVTITKGSLSATSTVIYNTGSGDITITDATIDGNINSNNTTFKDKGISINVVINGSATINGNVTTFNSDVSITGNVNITGYLFIYGGDAENTFIMTSGTINSSSTFALKITDTEVINISGGTISAKSMAFHLSSCDSNALINISGGTFIGGSVAGIYNASPVTINITGNTLAESSTGYAIRSSVASSVINIGSSSEDINEDTPIIRSLSSDYAIYTNNVGEWNFYNGSLWSMGEATYDREPTNKRSDSNYITATVTYNEETFYETFYAVVQVGEKYYGKLQSAIDDVAINGSAVLEMLSNVRECIGIPSEVTITLNFNGYSLKSCATASNQAPVINNKGTLYINKDDSTGTIYGFESTEYKIIDNYGTLQTNKLTIKGSIDENNYMNYGVSIYNNEDGNVEVRTSTINTYVGIKDLGGNIEINNSSFNVKNQGINTLGGVLEYNNSNIYSDSEGIYLDGGAVATINGGEISSRIYPFRVNNSSTLNLNKGNFVMNGSGPIVLFSSSIINIGNADDEYIDNSSCNGLILKNTFSGYGVFQLSGTNSAINFYNGCIYTINDQFSDESQILNNSLLNVSSSIVYETVEIEEKSYIRTTVAVASITSGQTTTYYSTLQGAIDSADTADIVVENSTQECLVVTGTKTISLNGKKVYCYNTDSNGFGVKVNGTATIQGSGHILSDNSAAIGNYGNLTIKDGVEVYVNSYPNVTVPELNAVIFNSGTLNINDENSTVETKIYSNCDVSYVINAYSGSLSLNKNAIVTDNGKSISTVIKVGSTINVNSGSTVSSTYESTYANAISFTGSPYKASISISGTVNSTYGRSLYINGTIYEGTVTINDGAVLSAKISGIFVEGSFNKDIEIKAATISTSIAGTYAININSTVLKTLNITGAANISSRFPTAIKSKYNINITGAATITGGVELLDKASFTFDNKDASIIATYDNNGIYSTSTGDIILNSGTIEGARGLYILNNSNLTVKDARIVSNIYSAILHDYSSATINVTGEASIEAPEGKYAIETTANLIIDGEALIYEGINIKGSATLTMNSGNIKSSNRGIYSESSGIVTVNGGSIVSDDTGIYSDNSQIVINGGEIEAEKTAICADGGTLKIYGGTITAGLVAIESSNGSIDVGDSSKMATDLTMASSGDGIVLLGSTASITADESSSIVAKGYGISVKSGDLHINSIGKISGEVGISVGSVDDSLTIGNIDDPLSFDIIRIMGSETAVEFEEGFNINFYNGSLYSEKTVYSAEFKNTRDGYIPTLEVFNSNVEELTLYSACSGSNLDHNLSCTTSADSVVYDLADDVSFTVAHFASAKSNISNDIVYSDNVDAIISHAENNAEEYKGENIEIDLLRNISQNITVASSDHILIEAGIKIIIDTNGKTITGKILNEEQLELRGEGKITYGATDQVVYNKGNIAQFILNGPKIENSFTTNSSVIKNDGELVVDAGTIFGGSIGINNLGSLDFIDGEIESILGISNINAVIVRSGSIKTTDGAGISSSGGVVEISSVNIESSNNYAVHVTGGTFKYTSGKLVGKGDYSYLVDGGTYIKSTGGEEQSVLSNGKWTTTIVDKVVKVDETYYDTINAAISAIGTGNKTIVLYKNITLGSLAFTDTSANIVLNLYGNTIDDSARFGYPTLTSNPFINNNSNLTIVDDTNGNGTIVMKSSKGYISNSRSLAIYGGTINAVENAIDNTGIVTIGDSDSSVLSADAEIDKDKVNNMRPKIMSDGYVVVGGRVYFDNGVLMSKQYDIYDVQDGNFFIREGTYIQYVDMNESFGENNVLSNEYHLGFLLEGSVLDIKDIDVQFDDDNLKINAELNQTKETGRINFIVKGDDGKDKSCYVEANSQNVNCEIALNNVDLPYLFNISYSNELMINYTTSGGTRTIGSIMNDLKIEHVNEQNHRIMFGNNEVITDGEVIVVDYRDSEGTFTAIDDEDFMKALFGSHAGNLLNLDKSYVNKIVVPNNSDACWEAGDGYTTTCTAEIDLSLDLKSVAAIPSNPKFEIIYYNYAPKAVDANGDIVSGIEGVSNTVCEFGSACEVEQLSFKDYIGNEIKDVNTVITLNGVQVDKIDTTVLGNYVVTTVAKDMFGNNSEAIVREYAVVDSVAPIIEFKDAIVIKKGHTFKDSDIIVSDNYDETLSVERITNDINFNKAGNYKIGYKVSDSSGNITIVYRDVVIQENNNIAWYLVAILSLIVCGLSVMLIRRRKVLN